MLEVIEQHRAAVAGYSIRREVRLLKERRPKVWESAPALGKRHGYRNAQVTVLAPTGTIGFLMDCDTTGIEPDIALVKYKLLAGGGMLKIVTRRSARPSKISVTSKEDERIIRSSPISMTRVRHDRERSKDEHDRRGHRSGLKEEHIRVRLRIQGTPGRPVRCTTWAISR